MDQHLSSQKAGPLMAEVIEEVLRKMAQTMAIDGPTDTEAAQLVKIDQPEHCTERARKKQGRSEKARQITGPEATMVPLIKISEGVLDCSKATFEAVGALLRERGATEDRQETGGGETMDSIEVVINERDQIEERRETGGMVMEVVGREDVATMGRTRGISRTIRGLGDKWEAYRVKMGNFVPYHGINRERPRILGEFERVLAWNLVHLERLGVPVVCISMMF